MPTSSAHPTRTERRVTDLATLLAGQFTIVREIGRGGMGIVYLARDDKLDRLVALKLLRADDNDPSARERFLREGRTAARLSHPNIVPIYRADEIGGVAFFTMAYIDGESLADRVRDRGPLPPTDAVRILRDVALALAHAHTAGIVHRDVKPENVLLDRASARALVTDFGIARSSERVASEPQLTQAGAVLGTLQYMSPEQVSGEALDGRSDLYSLGVVAYFILSGRLPFGDLAGAAVILAHATREPRSLLDVAPSVPPSLARVVHQCLAKRPDDRPASGDIMADALERALSEASLPRIHQARANDGAARLSEPEAAAVWRRAAQLQADALRRLESRADLLTDGATRTLPPATPNADATVDDDAGYEVAHVIAAAEEAGISNQYVAMALAERPQDALRVADETLGIDARQATLFLGTNEWSLAVSLVVPAPPAATLRALGLVLQQMPFQLQLRETIGPHPLDGGVMVFDLPGRVVGAGGARAGEVNLYWMGTRQQLEAQQVQVTLRRHGADAGRTEVTMTCDLRSGVRRNVRTSQWLAGFLGGATGLGTAALAAKSAAVVSAAVLGPASGVAIGVTALSLAWYRRLYPGTHGKAREEMRNALAAVSAMVRSEEVFGAG